MSKIDRALHGPSWTEVVIGAVLSLVLGVAIGVVLLVVKPVTAVKEVPKEPVAGTVYYVEGLRDGSLGRQVLAKRKAFTGGQSIKVTEQEVNALVDATNAPAAKPGAKGPAAAAEGMLVPGLPNVRIRNGSLQVAVPVTVDVWGFTQKVIVQARGGFEKESGGFTYEPTEIYFGSCPVQRLPFLGGYIRHQLLAAHPIPEDLAAAWARLANVSIEGNTLNLALQ